MVKAHKTTQHDPVVRMDATAVALAKVKTQGNSDDGNGEKSPTQGEEHGPMVGLTRLEECGRQFLHVETMGSINRQVHIEAHREKLTRKDLLGMKCRVNDIVQ